MRSWINCFSPLVVFLLYIVTLCKAANFNGLGGLPSDGTPYSVSQAIGISADGSTIVGSSHWVSGYQAYGEACYWSSTGIHGLGHSQIGGFFEGQGVARGVSSDGSVIVGTRGTEFGSQAFRWENGVMTELEDIPSGHYPNMYTMANSISANGSVIVGSSTSFEVVKWEDSVITSLGSGRAYSVSGDGSVIVGVSSSSSAFRWTSSTGMSGLNGLPNGGTFSSGATAVSSNGQVIVGGSYTSDDIYPPMEAFRWENGTAIGLGDLPGGAFYSLANDLSADGSVIVGYSVTSGDIHNGTKQAFIWDSQNGMRNFQNVLVNDYGLNLTGWSLLEATGISDNGMVIVGNGINPNGYEEAWIATVPEPATLLLLGFGAVFLRKRA
jgi:probable HAF family extracellular repeat protein